MKVWPKICGLLAGQLKGNHELPVPWPVMVCCDVPQHGQMMEQGAKRLLVQLISVRNRLAKGRRLHLPQQIGYGSKGSDLDYHPHRRPGHFQRVTMMFDEGLLAAIHFAVESGQGFGVDQGIEKMAVFEIAERAEPMPDFIRPAGPGGDFHALAGIENQTPKGAVELVQIPDLLEGGTGLKLIVVAGSCKRKAIGG